MGMMKIVLVFLVLTVIASTEAVAETRNYDDYFFELFFGDLAAELQTAEREHKNGILLVYELENCPSCERLNSTILSQSPVQDFYRQRFLVFRIDIRGDIAIVDFGKNDTTEKAFAAANRVRATPTCVFYGLDGKEVARFAGVPHNVDEFLLLGRYVEDRAYREISFVKYKATLPPR